MHPGKVERLFNTAVTVVTHVCRPRSPFRTLEVAPLNCLREWGFPVASAEVSAATITSTRRRHARGQTIGIWFKDVGARFGPTNHFCPLIVFNQGDGRSRRPSCVSCHILYYLLRLFSAVCRERTEHAQSSTNHQFASTSIPYTEKTSFTSEQLLIHAVPNRCISGRGTHVH